MTLTGSSSLKRNKDNENGISMTNGSLTVRLVKGKAVANLYGLAANGQHRSGGSVLIVYDRTESGEEPAAYCCITDDDEVRQGFQFECSSRFNTDLLIARYPDKHFLEISAFHILNEKKAHRAKSLLWQAITTYCTQKNIDYVLGCFSFDGKYPAQYALELSYLYHFCQTEPDLQVTAHQGVSMDIMPVEAINPDEALRFLPPLLRYCLRLGAKVGNGVAVNKSVTVIEVFLLFPARSIDIPSF